MAKEHGRDIQGAENSVISSSTSGKAQVSPVKYPKLTLIRMNILLRMAGLCLVSRGLRPSPQHVTYTGKVQMTWVIRVSLTGTKTGGEITQHRSMTLHATLWELDHIRMSLGVRRRLTSTWLERTRVRLGREKALIRWPGTSEQNIVFSRLWIDYERRFGPSGCGSCH